MLFGPTVALIELLFYCKHIKNPHSPCLRTFLNIYLKIQHLRVGDILVNNLLFTKKQRADRCKTSLWYKFD